MLTAFQLDVFQSCAFQEEALAGEPAPYYTKVGGDDVPRVEVWEKYRKRKSRDEKLEAVIREAYQQIIGGEPENAVVSAVEKEVEEVRAVSISSYSGVAEWLQAQQAVVQMIIQKRQAELLAAREREDEEILMLIL